jgi:hypothetical protein
MKLVICAWSMTQKLNVMGGRASISIFSEQGQCCTVYGLRPCKPYTPFIKIVGS